MEKDLKFDVIIPSAGIGRRFGEKKQWFNIRGKPILIWTLEKFLNNPLVDGIYIGVHKDDYNYAFSLLGEHVLPEKSIVVYIGGKERKDTVYNGLLLTEREVVMIHDAVRPFLKETLINRLVDNFYDCDGVIPAIPINDTIKEVVSGFISKTLKRESVYKIQTPQLFKKDVLLEGYKFVSDNGYYPDDASIAELVGAKIKVVEGDPLNIKITTKGDLEFFMANFADIRSGFGYDIHRLTDGDGITLGGIKIPCEYSLVGHSDGDVVLHALVDAILGSLSMGDIGAWFPPEDMTYRGMDSSIFLKRVWERVREEWELLNADITIILERPRLSAFKDSIRKRVAEILGVDFNRISVKAKTKEGLDSVGALKAVEAYALVNLRKKS
ncbi:MAG: 2-C-methyl-D-erythritol 4-phosphate cytidylyltransferase [Thermosulfidibacteraceae bacterium]|jgi:2-C-methyl-D-erythritol 4-phosphate cytidylyltransferase/2-C-methyl-D-erythritol 2,4-cyclodiphosphate synthase